MPDSLAEIVIAEALMSAEDLTKAVASADSANLPLVVPAIREFGVDEVSLLAAFRKHVRVSVLDPAKIEFDSDALREISLDDSRRLRALALSIGIYGSGPRLLRVAMADPTDAVAIAELEHISGCSVEPVLVTLSAVEEMIENAYKHFVTEVMKRGGSSARAFSMLASGNSPHPKTVPFHRISDEVSLSLRLRALVNLLVDKGVFEKDDYEKAVKALLKNPSA